MVLQLTKPKYPSLLFQTPAVQPWTGYRVWTYDELDNKICVKGGITHDSKSIKFR